MSLLFTRKMRLQAPAKLHNSQPVVFLFLFAVWVVLLFWASLLVQFHGLLLLAVVVGIQEHNPVVAVLAAIVVADTFLVFLVSAILVVAFVAGCLAVVIFWGVWLGLLFHCVCIVSFFPSYLSWSSLLLVFLVCFFLSSFVGSLCCLSTWRRHRCFGSFCKTCYVQNVLW